MHGQSENAFTRARNPPSQKGTQAHAAMQHVCVCVYVYVWCVRVGCALLPHCGAQLGASMCVSVFMDIGSAVVILRGPPATPVQPQHATVC